MRVALFVIALMARAHAGDLCEVGAVHRGALIDLDLDRAQLRGAMRLVADAANINLVVADDVTGTVSLHVKRVPWDAAACAIAALSHLDLRLDGTILLVRRHS